MKIHVWNILEEIVESERLKAMEDKNYTSIMDLKHSDTEVKTTDNCLPYSSLSFEDKLQQVEDRIIPMSQSEVFCHEITRLMLENETLTKRVNRLEEVLDSCRELSKQRMEELNEKTKELNKINMLYKMYKLLDDINKDKDRE